MNTPDEPGDELTRAYRNASDAEAGSPAAATRAAILAEARAAALRRTPAANDSRYVWRAAAGIAVLGVAVILWRQANHNLTPGLTVAAPEASTADAGVADAIGAADKPASTPPLASATAKVEKEVQPQVAAATRTREEPAAGAAASSDAPQANLQLARVSADARPPVPAADAAQAAGAMRKDAPDYQQLLQREFPEVWNGSESPHTVWVVMDAAGKVLRKGELSPGAGITPDQPFETLKPWQMVEVITASGRSLQLAVMSAN